VWHDGYLWSHMSKLRMKLEDKAKTQAGQSMQLLSVNEKVVVGGRMKQLTLTVFVDIKYFCRPCTNELVRCFLLIAAALSAAMFHWWARRVLAQRDHSRISRSVSIIELYSSCDKSVSEKE
jgi:hypothetical protein